MVGELRLKRRRLFTQKCKLVRGVPSLKDSARARAGFGVHAGVVGGGVGSLVPDIP